VRPAALHAARALAAAPGALWRFSRPHTLIGTTVSILAIWAIVEPRAPLWDLAATLLAGAAVNLFIVGLNQVEDVEIDRINKPFLPIPAGELSLRAAKAIVALCAALSIGMALSQGAIETAAVAVALAVGWAYSSPPLRLKRYPALAAGSISLVRAVVVNLGVCLHFGETVPDAVWALTLFVLPFSFAIAVLKDVPDVEGDRRYRIATFTVRFGARRVVAIGMGALTLGYAAMAGAGPLLIDGASPAPVAAGHAAALAVLWSWRARVDLGDRPGFTRFYLRVWLLFFAEYGLMTAAVLA